MGEEESKALRNRFYKLGRKRNIKILQDLGKLSEIDEAPGHDETKTLLLELIEEGRAYDLISAIELNEEEIQKEKDAML